MKKNITFLIACFVIAQTSYAATSALTESLLEYEAITTALGTNSSFENIIPPTEFIIEVKRITKHIDILGEVRYEILTRALTNEPNWDWHESNKKHHRPIKYIATLNVAPNPGIGPNIVTVENIVLTPTHAQSK